MKLSKRLQAVADLVSEGMRIADIGTDHGYIPIYLVETGKCPNAIAMDVNKGPLLRATEHIEEEGLTDKILTRLSDGLSALQPGECDAAVIAGMGGALVIKILEEGKTCAKSLKELILQPQSELSKVRAYLCENGYHIIGEDMVEEDGKFYPMMKVVSGNNDSYTPIELLYGKYLLEGKHPVLLQYLDKEIRTKEQILQGLMANQSEKNLNRITELQKELIDARAAYLRCL